MSRKVSLLIAGLVALTAATQAAAQSANGSIQATAFVYRPLAVASGADLQFGDVFPGVDKTVGVTDAGAGRLDITGQTSAPVSMTFALPAVLSDGGNTLPIGSWTGHWNTASAPTGGTDFTPSGASTNAALSADVIGALYVFIGAQVQPAAAQAAGSYSGTVSVTVVY